MTGNLLWPLRWPAHFGQGAATPLYERDARYDAGADEGAAAVRAARGAQHTLRRAAFVATIVQDNLFHSLFHAVPTREHAARVAWSWERVRGHCINGTLPRKDAPTQNPCPGT